MTTPTLAHPRPVADGRRFLFATTAEDFHARVQAGEFEDDIKREFIDGEVHEIVPPGPDHDAGIGGLYAVFVALFVACRAFPRLQCGLELPGGTILIPDAALVPIELGRSRDRHPLASQCYLVAEVSGSTRRFDLGEKARAYAAAELVEYWVLDLPGDALWVHRDPSPDGYRHIERFARGESIAPLAFPDFPVAVGDLLGAR